MKKFNDWTTSDQNWFIIDIVCIIGVTGLMFFVTGFSFIGLAAIIFCELGAINIFYQNNPRLFKR